MDQTALSLAVSQLAAKVRSVTAARWLGPQRRSVTSIVASAPEDDEERPAAASAIPLLPKPAACAGYDATATLNTGDWPFGEALAKPPFRRTFCRCQC